MKCLPKTDEDDKACLRFDDIVVKTATEENLKVKKAEQSRSRSYFERMEDISVRR